jgi:hypothetical protein
MSVPEVPGPRDPLPPVPKHPLGGCAVAFLVIVGIALLLPGICSLIFLGSVMGETRGSDWGIIVTIALITFLIGAGGIALIRYAVRNK